MCLSNDKLEPFQRYCERNLYIYIYIYKDSYVTMLIPTPEFPDPNMTSFVRLRTQDPGLKADSGCITILGGSWVVISGVISPLRWVISTVILLITLLITTHEPPNRLEEAQQTHIIALGHALMQGHC